ncbi:MAG: 6-carboxytetrahydropterin synthase [Bdellovibrionota bacterium]
MNQDLARFLELNQLSAANVSATLIQVRVEITTDSITASQMVLSVKDFNEIIKKANVKVGQILFNSLDELTLTFQTQISTAFKEYCVMNRRPDLQLASFELEFENALKLKVQNNDLEIHNQFNMNVVHDLPTDDAATHGHDMKIGVALAFKNWSTHPYLTSLQRFSSELKSKTQALLLEPLHKTKLNRHFLSPTGEQISAYFYSGLLKTKLGPYLKEVRVFETQKNQYSATEI